MRSGLRRGADRVKSIWRRGPAQKVGGVLPHRLYWRLLFRDMDAPSENVTFLFTDIERSSQLWEMHPQTMGRALSQHDELMRAVFDECRGHVFKTVGDAFCVAFHSALDAVVAAVSAQRQLAAAPWEETGPLRVRMALHSGEAERRDGDYFGRTLNRVARVLAAGHGGQTLLSRVTAERVREKLPDEISLRDLGERRLKDLSGPERIFQLIARDLPAEFPPLRSLEVLPNNLPAQVTSFIGRAREMAEVKRLLGGTRLLTLTGPGGTGKTRLSLQVAAEMLDRFPHGVWLIELATITDAALVPEAIVNAIDLRDETDRPALDTLLDALRTRQLLIVLDNCEHLIAACAQIAATLLRRCPAVKILASSREALNIDGETIWAVPTLAVPEFNYVEPSGGLDELEKLEAVQLFVERAVAVRPDFALTRENAPLIAKLCWRLDGIPLALELAAARVKILTLAQILARLDDRFRLLSAGSRAALPRQQTLGALIDWSYDLLSDPERILLRRLSVFVGGRTLEMAEEVCAGEGLERRDIFDLLCALVDKSLVMIEPGHAGENRYTLLESVWDYADERLAEHQETDRYRKKHLDFFVHFAEAAEPHLYQNDQAIWLERLGAEHYNLNRALRFSLENTGLTESGLRLAGALTRYWEVRNYLTKGYAQFQRLLAQTGDSIPSALRAKAEFGAGLLAFCQDRDAEALRHYRIARRLYEEAGMPVEAGLAEGYIGLSERNDGNAPSARTHLEEAKAVAERHGSERLTATALNGLGSLAADAGDFAEARTYKERSLQAARSLGDQWLVGVVSASLGKVSFAERDYAAARKFLREAISISRELGNKWGSPYALEAIGDICAEENNAAKAVQLYGAASAQRETFALAFSTTERASYDRAINRLRELVPVAAFDEQWSRGRSLGLQAATALALDPEKPQRVKARRKR